MYELMKEREGNDDPYLMEVAWYPELQRVVCCFLAPIMSMWRDNFGSGYRILITYTHHGTYYTAHSATCFDIPGIWDAWEAVESRGSKTLNSRTMVQYNCGKSMKRAKSV